MQSPQAKLKDIQRLLGVYPPISSGDPEQVVRNYLFAVEDYPAPDVTAAVDAFLKGSVPGANAAFLPNAPVLAAEARRQMNLRLDSEHRRRALQPQLAAPEIVRTPEEIARAKDLVANAVANLQRVVDEQAADQTKHRAQGWANTNARFTPDMDERGMARRLGFVTGDPEDHEAAA